MHTHADMEVDGIGCTMVAPSPDPPAAAEVGEMTPAEAALLDRLTRAFRRLDEGGVRFCVLRNRDRIPRSLLTGSDVDVIVPANTPVRKLVALLADLSPVHVVPHRSTLEVYLPAGELLLHLDLLINDREWRGARYLKNDEILEWSRDDRGMPVAWLPHQAFCAWFSSLTRQRYFKTRYASLISAAVREHPQPFSRLLRETFGERLGGELLSMAEQGEPQRAEPLAGRCRRTIWSRALRRRPLATLWGVLRHYLPEVKLLANPTGLSVAVLGPDGAGKSTVCAALAAACRAELPFRRVEVQHLYQRFLPRLSELKKGRFRRRPSAPAVTHDPHGKRPHGMAASVFALLYTAVDQWLSRAWYGRRKLAANLLLLHDRHMAELEVDPRRFRYGGPPWLARWFSRIFPKPDLVLLLDAPAEVLQSRKQEVPPEETARQVEGYREMVRGLPHWRIVNADRDSEQVIADAKQAIRDHLARRTARRFGI